MNTFFIKSLSLQYEENAYLTSQVINFITANNWVIANQPGLSKIIVLTAYISQAQEINKILDTIAIYHTKYYDKKIILCGRIADMYSHLYKAKRTICIGSNELDKFDKLFNGQVKFSSINANILHNSTFLNPSPNSFWIKIAQGCSSNCNYCLIPKKRREIISKPINNILSEVQTALDWKKRKIIFLADDCGSYGLDINTDLMALLDTIIVDPAFKRFPIPLSLNSFEPHRLIFLFPKFKNILKYHNISNLSLSIQSGSDRILKLLNRHYSIEEILKIVKIMRLLSPKTVYHTEIIYGFPSESSEEFIRSLKIINLFDKITFIRYNPLLDNKKIYRSKKSPEHGDELKTQLIEKLAKINPQKIKIYH